MLAMHPREWLEFMRREYLETFIREGGASIKFCVPLCERERVVLHSGLRREAQALGYLLTEVNATHTRIQLTDQIFFRIAEQIDWAALGRRVLTELCRSGNLEPPAESTLPFFQAVAERNGLDPNALLMMLRKSLTDQVLHRAELTRSFRLAMFALCHALLTGAPDSAQTVGALTSWLTGTNRNASAVKDYGIFSRINRNTARRHLESLYNWVRIAGLPGTIVVIDIARLAVAKNPKDELNYYSTAALLDVYEVLREFIDATDRLNGCLMVVVPDPSFLDADEWGRGMARYQALQFRIYDEVRNQHHVNPLGSLVRLAEGPEG